MDPMLEGPSMDVLETRRGDLFGRLFPAVGLIDGLAASASGRRPIPDLIPDESSAVDGAPRPIGSPPDRRPLGDFGEGRLRRTSLAEKNIGTLGLFLTRLRGDVMIGLA